MESPNFPTPTPWFFLCKSILLKIRCLWKDFPTRIYLNLSELTPVIECRSPPTSLMDNLFSVEGFRDQS